MHRSLLPVLVIVAAVSACSTRDATAATELLAQDSTLAARLATAPAPRTLALPDACAAVTSAPPASANTSQAGELTRRAYAAESLGNLQEARTLLRRASELDGTNGSATYHLGRTNEALGDRAGAVAAYCRFLTLSPTADASAEARQRVAQLTQLSPSDGRVASADTVRQAAPARRPAPAATSRRVAHRRSVVASRVASGARVTRSRRLVVPRSRAACRERAGCGRRGRGRLGVAARRVHRPSSGASSGAESGAARMASAGDVVAAGGQPSAVLQPSTAARSSGGGLSRTQRVGIGAAAGAIIGAATGRSVKGALIGAAAGGALGTMIGGRPSPVGRGIRPWASGTAPTTGRWRR